MFSDPEFDHYSFEEIPMHRDLYLFGEKYAADYDSMMLNWFKNLGTYEHIGYITDISVEKRLSDSIEIQWVVNFSDRFHTVSINLPKTAFIRCVGAQSWDEKPRIFVKDDWLDDLYRQHYVSYGWVDAIGAKSAMLSGSLTREKLVQARERVDRIAATHSTSGFVSFADTILIKTLWNSGYIETGQKLNYKPEELLMICSEIMQVFKDVLDLESYCIVTQGANKYNDEQPLHISSTSNHVSMNILGAPFADILAIEDAAKTAAKGGIHPYCNIYLDESFYLSLKTDRKHVVGHFRSPLTNTLRRYFCGNLSDFLSSISR